MMPGMPERRTPSYVRQDTTSLFAALDVATGAVIGKCYMRRRATEVPDFLKQIQRDVHTCVSQLETDIRSFIDLDARCSNPHNSYG